MSQCDHLIGRVDDYDGGRVYSMSDLGSFCFIDEIWKFCPLCGEPIAVTEQEVKERWEAANAARQTANAIFNSSVVVKKALELLHSKMGFIMP